MNRELFNKLDENIDKSDFISEWKAIFEDYADDINNSDLELILNRAKELSCKTELKAYYYKCKTTPKRPTSYLEYSLTGKPCINPVKLAEVIAEQKHYVIFYPPMEKEAYIFWYFDNIGVYRQISITTLQSEIKTFIRNDLTEYAAVSSIKAIRETAEQLLLLTDSGSNHIINSLDDMNQDENIIVFENGVLQLDSMQLVDHSPEYLVTSKIPCKWTGSQTETPVFDAYLRHLSNYDADSALSLMQFIGFTVSNLKIDPFKKSLFLSGAGNSGKSQYLKLIMSLVGDANSCVLPFDKLQDEFSTAALYGKRLAVDPDAKQRTCKEIQIFKAMTGGDRLFANPKGRKQFDFFFHGAYIVACNDLPEFTGDRGQQVYDRILPIDCGDTIPEAKRDKQLFSKMLAEKDGIVFKAVTALKRAIAENFQFVISEPSKALLLRYQTDNCNVLQFIEECCVSIDNSRGSKAGITSTAKLYEVYKTWCKNGGEIPYSKKEFKKSIAQAAGVPEYQVAKNSNGLRYYPYTLTAAAKEEYHIFDSITQSRYDEFASEAQ